MKSPSAADPPLPPVTAYIHLPWCVRKCPYCDFNSHVPGSRDRREEYVDTLLRDLESQAAALDGRPLAALFLGGGTPSLFDPAQVGRLLGGVFSLVDVAAEAEITLEANPGSVERGSMEGYRRAGVNRLSLGAQSFDDAALGRLGRIHGSDDVRRAYDEARRGGFDDINLDVMFALPGQSREAALHDVRAVVALSPEHVSYYQLTLERNTVFHARPPADLPDDDAVADMEAAARGEFESAGYRRYEISAWARDARECRHNLNYWTYGDYLGLGAGAHGKLTGRDGKILRTRNTAHPEQYLREMRTNSGARSVMRLNAEDALFEFMLNALRLVDGFDEQSFEARTGVPFSRLQSRLRLLRERGLLDRLPDRTWRPTERGFRFLNDLQAEFLPAATG